MNLCTFDYGLKDLVNVSQPLNPQPDRLRLVVVDATRDYDPRRRVKQIFLGGNLIFLGIRKHTLAFNTREIDTHCNF